MYLWNFERFFKDFYDVCIIIWNFEIINFGGYFFVIILYSLKLLKNNSKIFKINSLGMFNICNFILIFFVKLEN